MDETTIEPIIIPGGEETTDAGGVSPIFESGTEPHAQAATPPPVGRAQYRAEQYHYGLGEDSPGVGSLFTSVVSGNEKLIRESLASAEKMKRDALLQEKANELINSGNPLEPRDVKFLHETSTKLRLPDDIDPSTFLEKKFSEQVLREATRHEDPSDDATPYVFKSAVDQLKAERFQEYSPTDIGDVEYSDADNQNYRIASNFLETNLGVHKVVEDFLDRYQELGWGSTIKSFGKELVLGTPYNWWMSKNAFVESDEFGIVANLEDQIADIYSGKHSPAQAAAIVEEGIRKLEQSDPMKAKELALKVLSYSDSEKLLDRTFAVLGIAINAKIAVDTTKWAIRGATRTGTIAGIKDLTGQQSEAALRDVLTDMRNSVAVHGGARAQALDDLAGVIPSLMNPSAVMRDVANTRLSIGEANNLQDMLNNHGTGLLKATGIDPINVTRLEPGTEAFKEAVEQAKETARLVYPRTNQSIMSVEPARSIDDVAGNADFIKVNIGRQGAQAFELPSFARKAATIYGLRKGDYEVVKHGDRQYAIQVKIPIDETNLSVRKAAQLDTRAAPTATRVSNRVFNFFREKGRFTPEGIRIESVSAVNQGERLSGLSGDIIERESFALKRSERKTMEKFLEHQRDQQKWSNTVAEFESDWASLNGIYPKPQDYRAYFAHRQINDAEYFISNMRAYSMKSREGFMDHKFAVPGFTDAQIPLVEGKVVKEIPWELGKGTNDDAGILLVPTARGDTFLHGRKMFMPGTTRTAGGGFTNGLSREAIDQLVKTQGYRVINVSKYGVEAIRKMAKDLKLKDFPQGRIDYVVVKNMKSRPIGYQHLPYQPGGHFFYRDGYYIAQAKVINSRDPGGAVINDYYGDTNIFSARTQREAVTMAGHMERARALRAVGDRAGARAYVINNLPFSYSEFTRMFNPRIGHLDINKPISWRPANASIEDTHKVSKGYSNFNNVDASVHSVLSDDVLFRYGQERGARLSGLYNVGSQEHPIWKMEPSRLLDPYSAMRRSVSTMSSARYLDDLKIKSAERYVSEFSEVLVGAHDELEKFPLRTLVKGEINKTHSNKELVAKAQNYRRATLELLQSEHPEVTRLNALNEKVLRYVTGAARQDKYLSTLEKITETDPIAFYKYYAGFLPKMGFYSPKQFFLQSSGMLTTAALEGWGRTAKAGTMGWFMRSAIMNGDPRIIDEAAKRVFKNTGVKPKHFKESMDALQRSGFWKIGDTWADVNQVTGSGILNPIKKAADHSLAPFRGGERVNHVTAWNASYLKWREANPVMAFDRTARKRVLDYADALTLRMSRASAAANQRGLASIPSQFWTYQTRLMDAMWGDTFTAAQKGKLIFYHSLLYGVPIGTLGTSLGVFGTPKKAMEKYAIYEGWDLSDPVSQTALNGIPDMMINLATGGQQNLGETFGPGGLSAIPDILGASSLTPEGVKFVLGSEGRDGKGGFLDVMLGAAGTTLKSVFESASPVGAYITDSALGNPRKPIHARDFMKVLETVSMVKGAARAQMALNSGRYLSKNGEEILPDGTLGTADGAMMFLLGTMPKDVDKRYNLGEVKKAIREAQQEGRDGARKAWARFGDDNLSDEERREAAQEARIWSELGDLTPEQRIQVMQDALGPHQDKLIKLENEVNNSTWSRRQKWLSKLREQDDEVKN